jgi:hypothetical protein
MTYFLYFPILRRKDQMTGCIASTPSRTTIEITDEEHTLILLMRTMSLEHIIHVMALNKFLPVELSKQTDHITNKINLHFEKSYELHTVRAVIDFIANQLICDQMFHQHSVNEMIGKYQTNRIAQSDGVFELYLKPYQSQCIQCEKPLKLVFSHRSKTVITLTRTYKAREW